MTKPVKRHYRDLTQIEQAAVDATVKSLTPLFFVAFAIGLAIGFAFWAIFS